MYNIPIYGSIPASAIKNEYDTGAYYKPKQSQRIKNKQKKRKSS